MKYFIIYLIVFIVVFLLYKLYFVIRTKNNVKGKIIEEQYLECKHKIKIKDKKELYNFVSVINSLILTFSYAVFHLFDKLYLQIIITIITVFLLIFLFYEILGNYYKKR